MSISGLPSTREQLERFQKRDLKMDKGPQRLFHWEKLTELWWTVQPGQKAQGHLISVCKYLRGGCKKEGAKLFPVVSSDRRKRQLAQTKTQKVPSEHWEIFFTVTVTEHWHTLPRDCGVSVSTWRWSWAMDCWWPCLSSAVKQVPCKGLF